MSLPPQFIQVKRFKKRKADDHDNEGVLDYLRVDGDRKRHRSGSYIYRRQPPHSVDVESNAGRQSPRTRDKLPVIHASKPGDENLPAENTERPENSRPDASAQTAAKPQDEAIKESATSVEAHTVAETTSATEQRRFHMSRISIAPSPLFNPLITTGKRSRNKTPATIFVERGHKRTRTEDVPMKDAVSGPDTPTSDSEELVEQNEPPRKQKLPGSDRKTTQPGKRAVAAKSNVTESMKSGWERDMDQISRDMNEFVLQQIGEKLARIEERDQKEAAAAAKKQASVTSPQTSKFRPKVPARRYAERHPEVAVAQQKGKAAAADPVENSEGYETGDEDDYVIETYIRVPLESLGKAIDPEKVGLLVFDNEPDADFFYGEEGDSDDEWPEDDEDENAENYYTADYPDDEVDSDDEYDRDAYHYRTRNASDLEEYDEREDDLVLDYGDDGEHSVPLSERFAPRPPAAFKGI